MPYPARLKKKKYLYFLLPVFIFFGLFYLIDNQYTQNNLKKPVSFGVSYSPEYAQKLGLDPKVTFDQIINDLKIKKVRLSANWDQIEPKPDKFDFTSIDYFIDQSTKNNIEIILAIGYKLPRWPECRSPQWLDSNDLPYLRQRQLIMLQEVIKHYESNPNIKAWQIENEPLLDFGVCPNPDRKFLETEVELVKNLSKKPVIITDAGEPRIWRTTMALSDIFGTTLYRVVYVPIVGDFQYPLPPWSYPLKSHIIKNLFASKNQETIISELQAEVWTNKFLTQIPIEKQIKSFSLDRLKSNILYARKTGFSQIYLWGVEWWYYLASNNHPEYLDTIKLILID